MVLNVKEFDSKVLSIRDYADETGALVKVLKLEIPSNIDLDYKSGQFAMLGVPGFEGLNNSGKIKMGAFSICSSPLEKGFLEFCIRIIPEHNGLTKTIGEKIFVGSIMKVKAPFGMFVLDELDEEIVLAATGTGIAPMMSIIRTIKLKGLKVPIVLFFGFRNSKQFLYGEELQKLSNEMNNFTFLPIASDSDENWKGETGFIQKLIEKYEFKNKEKASAYLCGVPAAIHSCQELLTNLGFKNIKSEKF